MVRLRGEFNSLTGLNIYEEDSRLFGGSPVRRLALGSLNFTHMTLFPDKTISFGKEPQQVQDLLARVNQNLQNLSQSDLYEYDALLPPSGLNASRSTDANVLRLDLMTEVRNIVELSQQPSKIVAANFRNLEIARSNLPPILNGDFLHGTQLQYLPDTAYGLLAGDFYGGGKDNMIPFKLYVSELINLDNTQSKKPNEIIKSSNSEVYGLGQGKLTYVLAKDGSFRKRVSSAPAGNISHVGSLPKAISVGIPSYDIKACVVSNSSDIPRVQQGLLNFDFYIPAYTGDGKLIQTPQQFLSGKKLIR